MSDIPIVIEKVINENEKEYYKFYVDADHTSDKIKAIFWQYELRQRKTSRHKFRAIKSYDRTTDLKTKDIYVPTEIRLKLMQDIIERLEIIE